MRLKQIIPVIFIGLALILSGVWVVAGDSEQKSEEEMMELMMKYATPGDHHKMLEQFVGSWQIKTKRWVAPGAPAVESEASSVVEWMLGERYIVEKVEGMMEEMPFHGFGIRG